MEIYVSTDVESNGPIPGKYSMLNFGSVALNRNGDILGKFEVNLLPLDGAIQHPNTMAFWAKHPDVWKQITANQKQPKLAMTDTMIG